MVLKSELYSLFFNVLGENPFIYFRHGMQLFSNMVDIAYKKRKDTDEELDKTVLLEDCKGLAKAINDAITTYETEVVFEKGRRLDIAEIQIALCMVGNVVSQKQEQSLLNELNMQESD